jgi:hypothetical protein
MQPFPLRLYADNCGRGSVVAAKLAVPESIPTAGGFRAAPASLRRPGMMKSVFIRFH